ncbi:MAG: hypothetical protein M0R76_02005 [Proteobacteria bacterium]|nr:hypothetical protein [Pseudomonadota bacterium]
MKNFIVIGTMFLLGCTFYHIYPEGYTAQGPNSRGPSVKFDLGKKELLTDTDTDVEPGPGFTTVEQVIAKSKGVQPGLPKREGPLHCRADEVSLFDNTLCVRVCPVGTNMVEGKCVGKTYFHVHEHVLSECKKLDKYYRFITLEEITRLFEDCDPQSFNLYKRNTCIPFLKSEAKDVFIVTTVMFDSWIGEKEMCENRYGVVAKNCAWMTRFFDQAMVGTPFDFLRGNAAPGSAVATGFCVRD